MKKKWICCFFTCGLFAATQAQKFIPDHDTTYYKTYRDRLTARAYLSRKYTSLHFNPPSGFSKFVYSPNTTLNLGIGATYHAFTLNIGIGISRFNPDEVRGKTRYLDLQAHYYARKWNFDLLGEFYRGYYLTPKGDAAPPGETYYTRNDLRLNLVGLAAYRCLNEKKFSYQAGLLQNEWQKKSAGSVLVGAEVYYGAVFGDSALAPRVIDSIYVQKDIERLHFFEIGPGVGYAYTLVIRQHFFALASATVNLSLRVASEHSVHMDRSFEKTDFTPNTIFHAGIGYNTDKWNLSALWVSTRLYIHGPYSDYKYSVGTGNYRLIYARRLALSHKVKKALQPIPDIMGK